MADNAQGNRVPIDLPNGLGGVHVQDDGSGGLVESQVFGYAEPDVPTFLSPGNQRKVDLGSERN